MYVQLVQSGFLVGHDHRGPSKRVLRTHNRPHLIRSSRESLCYGTVLHHGDHRVRHHQSTCDLQPHILLLLTHSFRESQCCGTYHLHDHRDHHDRRGLNQHYSFDSRGIHHSLYLSQRSSHCLQIVHQPRFQQQR